MQTFDDFDAWGDAISGASLRLACESVEVRRWTLGGVNLGEVTVQLAFEGGGNICYGGNAHPGTMLFVPLTHATAHVVNGQQFDDDAILAIPRHADFRIHVRKVAHTWCSIALPFDGFGPSAWIARNAAGMPELKRLACSIVTNLLGRPGGTAAHHVAGRELAAAASACLARPLEKSPALGRPRLSRDDIVRGAMAFIDQSAVLPTASHLARHLGTNSRTLLRTFQESFGVSPKRYLMLRELHAVRRDLRAGAPKDATVADVLTRHGIWEFGRFAARYRRHFAELPSATLRQARS